jgi:hypothetical protein
VACGPLHPADRGGQHHLGAQAVLLGAQPQRRLDRVAGGGQREDRHRPRDVGVGEDLLATEPLKHVLELRALVGHVTDAVGHAADQRAHDGEPGGPRHHGGAVQPPGEGDRAAQRRRRRRRAEPCRQDAGAHVPPGQHGEGHRDQHDHERDHEPEDPPALVGVGAGLLCPADRGQPRQPPQAAAGTGGVAGGAQREGDAEDAERDPPGATGAIGELGGHGSDRGEHPAGGGHRQAVGDRADDRQPDPDHPRHDDRAEHQVGGEGDQQRRGQRRVAADHGRAEQLAPSRLLVGTGVPDDGEQAGQADHREDEPGAPGGDRAEGGAEHRPEHGEQARGARHRPVQLLEVGRGAVELVDADRGVDREQGQHQHPERQEEAVPPQDQPDQSGGTGKRAHRDAPSGRPFAAAPAGSSAW